MTMINPKKKTWKEMSDDELMRAICDIIIDSSSADEVNARAKKEFGYDPLISITWNDTGSAFMATFQSKEGKCLSLY